MHRSISLSPALVSAATDCLEATSRLGFRVLKASRLDLDLEVSKDAKRGSKPGYITNAVGSFRALCPHSMLV